MGRIFGSVGSRKKDYRGWNLMGMYFLAFCIKTLLVSCGGYPKSWNSRTNIQTLLDPFGFGVILMPIMAVRLDTGLCDFKKKKVKI